jgi:uncharacterized protein YtpQ (UPF0354 family)
MTRDEAHKIVSQALFLISKDQADAALFSSGPLFGDFMFNAIKTMYRDCEVVRTDILGFKIESRKKAKVGSIISFGQVFDELGKDTALDRNSQLVELVLAVARIIDGALKQDEGTADLSKVIPLVSSASTVVKTLERNRMRAAELGIDQERNSIIHWTVTEDIVALLAIPQEDSFLYVTDEMRIDSGIALDELKSIAMNNLKMAFHQAKLDLKQTGSGTEITGTGGAASSFILLDGFLDSLARQSGSDLLVYSGDTDHLMIVPTKNHKTMAKVLGGYAIGKLPTGSIPQLIYSDGNFRPINRDDIAALVPKILPSQPPERLRHH